MAGRRIDYLNETELQQYRSRSEKAINGINLLLDNLHLISNKGNIVEKYRTIAQYIGLIQDGNSHYNYFIPLNQNIVFMLRFSNHNNENEELYNIHEKKGRPDVRYVIFFQGNEFDLLFNGGFCEAKQCVYNYPINEFDKDENIVSFLSILHTLFTNGKGAFGGMEEKPRLSNGDVFSQWNRTIDKNTGMKESKTHKNMKKETIKMNETQLRNMIAESVKKVLKESSQEDLYHIIANLEADIKTVISNTDSSSSQAFGSPDEKFKMIVNSLTHIDSNLSMKAESTFNKLLGVISELQDLRISLKTLGAKDSYWGHDFNTSSPDGTVSLSNYRH